MKILAPAVAFALSLAPTLALACPGAAACGSSCLSSGLGGYLAALGVGLLAGVGSVSLEGFVRRGR